MFVSTFTNGIDAKGRVSVPAEFRAETAKEGFAGVYVWPSFNGGFLEGAGMELLEAYAEALEEMEPYDERRTSFEMVIFGGAKALMFDSTGRVSLPKPFMEHAGLSKSARFIGLGRRFEIWDPEAHENRAADALAYARENKNALRPTRRSRQTGGEA
ncbi:MAG: division/cell wall cluster transcriptional repressor MraZ [Oceanicaulis sp.]